MTISYFFIQLLGFAAIGLGSAVFQTNRRSRMLNLQVCASLTWMAHFFLLGAYTGAAMNLVNATRTYTFCKTNCRERKSKPVFFVLVFILATVLTWHGFRSLMPLIGSLIGTYALWQTNTSRIRLVILLSPCVWFIYNFLSGSYAGMIADVIGASSVLVGIYRFDVRSNVKSLPVFAFQKQR